METQDTATVKDNAAGKDIDNKPVAAEDKEAAYNASQQVVEVPAVMSDTTDNPEVSTSSNDDQEEATEQGTSSQIGSVNEVTEEVAKGGAPDVPNTVSHVPSDVSHIGQENRDSCTAMDSAEAAAHKEQIDVKSMQVQELVEHQHETPTHAAGGSGTTTDMEIFADADAVQVPAEHQAETACSDGTIAEVDKNTNTIANPQTSGEQVLIVSNVLLATPSVAAVEPPTTSLITIPSKEHLKEVQIDLSQTSLGLLAQYDSDIEDVTDRTVVNVDISDTDSVVEVPASSGSNKNYRKRPLEISSESDTDTDGSDVEYLTEMRTIIDKNCMTAFEDDDDEDEHVRRIKNPPKVKGELLLDELPPIEDLHITVPEEECVQLGRVQSIVEQLVLVTALQDAVLVDLDTVLFLDKGKRVLGAVFDVIGQVGDPLYCVRFNTHEHIAERGVHIGDLVYMAPKTEYTQFIVLSNIMGMRGSDASWEHDVEPPASHLDYSDDEQERAAAARAKARGKSKTADEQENLEQPPVPDYSHDEQTLAGQASSRARRRTNKTRARAPQPEAASAMAWSVPTGDRGGYAPDGGRGPPRGRPFNTQRYPGPAPPGALVYAPNFNPNSWHSNYYPPPPMRGGPRNYYMPPRRPPPPLPHGYHPQRQPRAMYGVPPPGFVPYMQLPPPPLPHMRPHGPPMAAAVAPPPPPPPGEQ